MKVRNSNRQKGVLSDFLNLLRTEIDSRRLARHTGIAITIGAVLCCGVGEAQSSRGSITGTVSDTSGAVIGEASVVLTHTETGISRTVASNEAGIYRIDAAELGTYEIAVTQPGFRLKNFTTNVWRAELRPAESSPVTAQLLISSTRQDTNPRFSPDGKKIAFLSDRSGGPTQIWISNADGRSPVQLTSLNFATFYPMWSPDNEQILFHAPPNGQGGADLFSIAAAGGSPKQLTTEASDDLLASYSRDGKWVYFSSNRSGESEIWKMPAAGGDATRITYGGAKMPIESWDGKTLFYAHRNPEKGIWKTPIQGGDAEQVTGPIATDAAFAVGTTGIYYVTPPENPTQQLIRFLSFSTKESRSVVVANHQVGLGLSLSPDERYLIFAQRDDPGSDLMLIKDFVPPR